MKTKTYLLAAAMTAVVATGAGAADMPVYKAPPPPVVVPPPPTWTGFYLGINGGAVWYTAKATTTDYIESCYYAYCYYDTWNNSHSKTKAGGTIGGTIGYNWQSGAWVYGIEGDMNWASAKLSATRSFYDSYYDLGVSGSISSELTWLATIRGRLGYSWGPTMIYATGGVAFAGVKNSLSATVCDYYWSYYCVGASASNTKTKTGWTAGGGIEHMFSPNWTVKAEALYVDLGSTSLLPGSGYYGDGYGYSVYGTTQTKISQTAVIARVGLNYKFGGY